MRPTGLTGISFFLCLLAINVQGNTKLSSGQEWKVVSGETGGEGLHLYRENRKENRKEKLKADLLFEGKVTATKIISSEQFKKANALFSSWIRSLGASDQTGLTCRAPIQVQTTELKGVYKRTYCPDFLTQAELAEYESVRIQVRKLIFDR